MLGQKTLQSARWVISISIFELEMNLSYRQASIFPTPFHDCPPTFCVRQKVVSSLRKHNNGVCLWWTCPGLPISLSPV